MKYYLSYSILYYMVYYMSHSKQLNFVRWAVLHNEAINIQVVVIEIYSQQINIGAVYNSI